MKSINFKRQNSVLRVVNEEAVKNSFNWDRVLYLVILLVGVIFLGFYLFNRFYYVKANGQVIFENLQVRLIDDATIMEWHVREGEKVFKGDSLFTYVLDEDENFINSMARDAMDPSKQKVAGEREWVDREKFNIQKTIALNNILKQEKRKLINTLKEELNRMESQVILDVLPIGKMESAYSEIQKLESAISSLDAENAQLRALIGMMPSNKKEVEVAFGGTAGGIGGGGGAQLSSLRKVYYSPIEGTVTRQYISQFETVLKDEYILTINKNRNIFVKGYFEQEDLKFLKEGDEVKLVFPDGTESYGLIYKFYFSTFRMPEEFQKKYEPTTRTLAADIIPKDEEERKKWKAFYKMEVSITKSKF